MINPMTKFVREDIKEFKVSALAFDIDFRTRDASSVVFKIDTTGGESVLYTFKGGTTDGYDAIAGLVRDAAGNLFGTTYRGGAFGVGTVFRLDAEGRESLVHNFSGGSDGLVS